MSGPYNYQRILIAIIAAAISMSWNTSALAEGAHGDTLAIVNDVPITQQDLAIEAAQLKAEMRYRNRPLTNNQLSKLRTQLIENLIDRELLYHRAQQRKIKIRKRWVDLAIKELKSQLGDKKAYGAFLSQTGLTPKQLKSRIEKGLIVRRMLRREVIRQIKVSEAEKQAFFKQHPEFFQHQEQIRVRHILIAADDQDNAAKRKSALLRIQSIQLMLHENPDFASLALAHSDDPSKVRGGDIGYLQRDQMISDFAEAAFMLAPGEISDIVTTRFGYHLIKAIDRIPPSAMAYRNARTKIERTLRRNKEKKATVAYLAQQKRQSSITRLYRTN